MLNDEQIYNNFNIKKHTQYTKKEIDGKNYC